MKINETTARLLKEIAAGGVETDEETKRLRLAAQAMLDKAESGDVAAIKDSTKTPDKK